MSRSKYYLNSKSKLKIQITKISPLVYISDLSTLNSKALYTAEPKGCVHYTDMQERIDTLERNMLLLENPQFLPNNYETM